MRLARNRRTRLTNCPRTVSHPTTIATFSRAEAAALLELYILDANDEEVGHIY